MSRYGRLAGTHDLSLPDFGPYARDLMTLSHIADVERGLRMDFFLVPGIHRRSFFPPLTLRECGYYPMEASGDFGYYSMHQDLEGRDAFFSETSYSRLSDRFRLGRIVFVNRTKETQAASLMYFARFVPPAGTAAARLPPGGVWIDALDYTELHYARKRFDTHLVTDGGRRGEEPMRGAVGGRVLGRPSYPHPLPCFGEDAGDRAEWHTGPLPARGGAWLRVRMDEGCTVGIEIRYPGGIVRRTLAGSGRFAAVELLRGELAGGRWSVRSLGGAGGFRLDGLFFLPEGETASEALFPEVGAEIRPQSSAGPVPGSVRLRLDGVRKHYLAAWSSRQFSEREYRVDCLTEVLIQDYRIRQPYYRVGELFSGDGREYCREVYELPIVVPPGESRVRYLICGAADGDAELTGEFGRIDRSPDALEAAYRAARNGAFALACTPAGKRYRFGQRLMSAALMTNIGFPIPCRGKQLRCHIPDKYYWSLYSWDSGFAGLGLLELDRTRAIENLNAYLTPPGDADCAFILHGTPLPVQAYLLAEIWNREPEAELLRYFYPRLRHMYRFLAGHTGDSTFRRANGLLAGWDYFYNSGGWDDYPPQWRIREERRNDITPVAPTAHAIRCARFLINAADELGLTDDIAGYEADIAALAGALQERSWDPEAGVFSYAVYGEDGSAGACYRDPVSGVNYNLGLDGASVLLAGGVCDEAQEARLLELLETPGRCWSEYGLSAVDQSAPYFRRDGYWNGGVWMPHQWFFWKAMLDAGRMDFARRIALTALGLWERETELSRGCFEHFSLSHGRGCGCPHFGALSAPVLCWFGAYFAPGRLTGGFDFWVSRRRERPGRLEVDCRLGGRPGRPAGLLYVAGSGKRTIRYRGEEVASRMRVDGCLEFNLPGGTAGTLEIVG